MKEAVTVEQVLDLEDLPDTLDELAGFVIEQGGQYPGVMLYHFLEALASGYAARTALERVKQEITTEYRKAG